MNLVMDVMFCDSLEFSLSRKEVAAIPPMPSMEQTFVELCRYVGIELISYDIGRIMHNDKTGRHVIFLVGASWVKQRLK